MLKKHSFSPNHKVVAGKHNFHPQGQPGTASMGKPPTSMPGPSAGGGGDSNGDGQDGGGGGMDGMNFCDGGKKYDDGGVIDDAAEGLSRFADKVTGSSQYDPNSTNNGKPPLSGGDQKSNPGEGLGGAQREKTMDDAVDKMSR
jgi:hypothetical protein